VTEPVPVGQVLPRSEPRDVPDEDLRFCGHCSDGLLGTPQPEQWLPGFLDAGERPRFSVLQYCNSCSLPSVMVWTTERDDAGQARIIGSAVQSPFPPPPSLSIVEYTDTDIAAYYEEAWRCRRAGLRRAALVMARSTLQACYRRYLLTSERGSYSAEQQRVADLAGPGWAAVAVGVRDFGNTWAHPEGTADPPKWSEVKEAFRRMKSVLAFTAEMERVGHLRPAAQREN
jgi:hypothetical protein